MSVVLSWLLVLVVLAAAGLFAYGVACLPPWRLPSVPEAEVVAVFDAWLDEDELDWSRPA